VLDGGEECDDANVVKGDGCSDLCERDAAYVFVTSKQFAGDLGGLAAADMNCEMAAKMAALPGIYRAWLSDDVTPAISRLKPIDRPYVRTDGVQVAASFAQIVVAAGAEIERGDRADGVSSRCSSRSRSATRTDVGVDGDERGEGCC
jgi:cysteine-rich repeat protein